MRLQIIVIVMALSSCAWAQHSNTLTWVQSTDSVQGNRVFKGGVSGGPYSMIACLVPPITTYVDTSVVAGQTNYYVVTAFDGSCSLVTSESVNSNEVSATTPLSPATGLTVKAK